MIRKAPFVVLFVGLIFMIVGILAPSSCSISESSGNCNNFALLEKSFFEKDIRGNDRTFEDALALNHQGLNIAIGIVAVLLVLVIRPKVAAPLWIVAIINLALVANARFYFEQVFYKDDGFGSGYTPE